MSHPVLERARVDLGLSVPDLWLAYFALGGHMDADELRAYLTEDGADGAPHPSTSDSDHDTIVHALNEAFGDAGRDSPIPYRVA